MLAHSILAAQQAGVFDDIVVSTDDPAIAAVAREWGASTPFMRPAELADDHTGTSPVVCHALDFFAEQGTPVTDVCLIYATAPLIQAQALRDAYTRLQTSDARYVFSATRYGYPIQRALYQSEQGGVEMVQPEHRGTRSQDLREAFHDAGQFYWGRAQAFLQNQVIFAAHSKMHLLPQHQVQDIDTEADWQRAELLYQLLHPSS